MPAYSVEMEILRVLRNLRYFLYLKFGETILEIKYAAPLAVNGIVSCDLGFYPKLERNIRIEG